MNSIPLQAVYTAHPKPWKCCICDADVQCEGTQQLNNGKVVNVWYPASRYWKSPGHPSKTIGVFCSAICATTNQ